MNWKKTAAWLLTAASITGVSLFARRLYRYGFGRYDTSPGEQTDNQEFRQAFQKTERWLAQQPQEDWWLDPNDPQNRRYARFLPAPKTKNDAQNKAVILAHGYHFSNSSMAVYAYLFQQLGYAVLMPDNRAHGRSAGKWINFGWYDRLDYRRWCDQLIKRLGTDSQLVLFGTSMGGSIVMLMSGEALPPQVKAIIEDCGYSTLMAELAYRLKVEFHLPEFPALSITNLINRSLMHFNLKDVDCLRALKRNRLPILFIHGERDDYVPPQMALANFQATSAPKELWLVPNAGHMEAVAVDPHAYLAKLRDFLQRYVP